MRTPFKAALLVAALSLLTPVVSGTAAAATKPVTVVTAPTWKSSTAVKDVGISGSGTIAPAYGRTLVVQKMVAGTWKAYRTIKTANTAKATVSVALPKTALWDGRSATTTTSWRVHLPATPLAQAYTSPTTKVVYRTR